MTYEELIERVPKGEAGDLRTAQVFVEILNRFMVDEGALSTLPLSQRKYLYRLRKKWTARAKGEDTRWLEKGSTGGRPTKPTSGKAKRTRGYREEPMDDLSRRLIERYSKIRPE